jgi:hypothetical protein
MNVFLSKFGEGYLPLTVPTIKCQPKMYLKNEKFLIFSSQAKKCLRGSPLCDMVPIVYGEYCYSCYKVVAICNWQENQVYYRM